MVKTRDNGKKRRPRKRVILVLLVAIFHALGFVSSLNALDRTRTAQGTVAWVVALNTIPYVAVPAYWVFGKTEFQGYISARQAEDDKVEPTLVRLKENLTEQAFLAPLDHYRHRLIEDLVQFPVTIGNDAELLIDGAESFKSIFEGIRRAENYVLVQFYTIADDEAGDELKAVLMERALAGVRCFVTYDGIGTQVAGGYFDDLVEAGVQVIPFATVKGIGKRFQVNFRNHRKIVVVDGREAWVGGLNIAEVYRDDAAELGPWRDTHMKVSGPVVQNIQFTFVEDWHWVAGEILEDLEWQPQKSRTDGYTIGSLPSGPADWTEVLSLFVLDLIHSAQERVWIATPYFVPDPKFVRALELAALRGVDVRILIPEAPDTAIARLALLSSWNFVEPFEAVGARVYQYTAGFLHQKVMLVDDTTSIVGSANFDARSFRLNFEITLAVMGPEFAEKMEVMLEKDFAHGRLMTSEQLKAKGYWFNIATRAAYLAAPIL